MPNDYINIAIQAKTREKIRLIADQTDDKMAKVVDVAVTEYAKKILPRFSVADKKVIEA